MRTIAGIIISGIALLAAAVFDLLTKTRLIDYTIALVLLYKCAMANKISDTVAQDPMELWLAIGIASVLMSKPFFKSGKDK